jgi:hypothetical protein
MVVHVSRIKRYTQRDSDMHQALQEANEEAERNAAGVLVLPLQAHDGDVIDDAVGGSTRSRVAARPRAPQASRQRTQRVKGRKELHSASNPSHEQHSTEEEDVKHDEQDDHSAPTSSPPAQVPAMPPHRVVDIAQDSDSDIEEGEVRIVLPRTHTRRHYPH